jgi:CRISPR/Cas system-associated protein Csm6
MVEMILADHPQTIIDFGASNSVYDDEQLLSRVKNALAPYPQVILLLPSPDTAESNQILKERLIKMLTEAGKSYSDELFELNNTFIQHPSNRLLAKKIVYTKGKTAETICAEILAALPPSQKPQAGPITE